MEIQDYIGKTFNKWTVLDYVGVIKKRKIFKCRCECGTIQDVPGSSLFTGHSKGCRFCAKRKDLVGKTFGKLQVIEIADIKVSMTGRRYTSYKCLCECGNTHIATTACLQSGRTKSCGCLKTIAPNKKDDREEAMLRVQYSAIKKRNKLKGFSDVISFKTFKEISKQPCHYCGVEYSKEITDVDNRGQNHKNPGRYYVSDHVLKINGIDRLDPTKGYVDGNCVSCCTVCNYAKNEMTLADFKNWLERIYNNKENW